MSKGAKAATIGWLITAVYYFYQYTLRSAPAVMMPELSTAFGLTAAGVASMAGLFYYGYSPFSLVAGVAMDRIGPRRVVPIGAATVGIGALMFASGNPALANVGRFLQGAGGVFALVGAAYIATTSFPASRAATLIGATQMFGMAGGSAGQFVVGPLIGSGMSWSTFWAAMGIAGLVMAALLYMFLPEPGLKTESPGLKTDTPGLKTRPTSEPDNVGRVLRPGDSVFRPGSERSALHAFGIVFRNPQSILCGVIAGLIFIPTTIFDMVWGVRYLQEGHGLDYASAVLRSASVPFGWIIGCPLLGFVSDRIGRRKPVIASGGIVLLACLAWILYGTPGVFPPYVLGLTAGIASGAAMLPYTVIKEANPPEFSGTSTGVVNFINFTFSALLGPVFAGLLASASGGAPAMELEHYQTAFRPLLYGVALAIALTFLLRETGPAAPAAVRSKAMATS